MHKYGFYQFSISAIRVVWFFISVDILGLSNSFFLSKNFCTALSETLVNQICFLDPGIRLVCFIKPNLIKLEFTPNFKSKIYNCKKRINYFKNLW